jgi:hypothetical protein
MQATTTAIIIKADQILLNAMPYLQFKILDFQRRPLHLHTASENCASSYPANGISPMIAGREVKSFASFPAQKAKLYLCAAKNGLNRIVPSGVRHGVLKKFHYGQLLFQKPMLYEEGKQHRQNNHSLND